METELMVGLIVGGAATFTSLLIVGIQIIFYTKTFEEEYRDKVEKIKLRLKTKIDEFILDLTTSKMGELLSIIQKKKDNKKINKKKILEDFSHELIEVHELDELLEYTYKHNKWSHFMVDCKGYIRKIGVCVIVSGIIVILFFSLAVFIKNLEIISFMFFTLLFIGLFMLSNISEYHKNLKNVDKTYERLQTGLEL